MRPIFILTTVFFCSSCFSRGSEFNNYLDECESHLRNKMMAEQKANYLYTYAGLTIFENYDRIVVRLGSDKIVSRRNSNGITSDGTIWSICHVSRSSSDIKFSSLDKDKYYAQHNNTTEIDKWFTQELRQGETVGIYEIEFSRKSNEWFLVNTRFNKIKN